jgi:hypothetical protein
MDLVSSLLRSGKYLDTKETAVAMENGNGGMSDKDTLYMLGGVALVVFGAGLILTNPIVRRYMGQLGVGDLASLALPDLDRYLKLRAM